MTDETPAPSRWTPEVVIGLLCLVAAAVLPHLGLEAAASGFAAMAFWLLSPIRSPLTPGSPPPPPRGYARADVLVTALALGLALFGVVLLAASAGGCATTKNGGTYEFVLQDHLTLPAPACHYRFLLDGELDREGDVDVCPSVPVCSEVKP